MNEKHLKLPLPNLIIGGVHKAGTTSVFAYLSIHPQVCASRKKELGFFIPARYKLPVPSMSEYAENFFHFSNEKYIIEATPSYLYGKDNIADAILKNLGPIKIIFILREPIDRLYSFYQYSKMSLQISQEMNFDQFVEMSHTYEKGGIRKSESDSHLWQGIIEGFYINFLKSWQERFKENMKIYFFDDLQNNTPVFMESLCKWMDIDFNQYKPSDFTVENRTVVFRNRFIHKYTMSINRRFEPFWRANHQLKKTVRRIYHRLLEKQKNEPAIHPSTYIKLQKIYQPYNAALYDFLIQNDYKNLPKWLVN